MRALHIDNKVTLAENLPKPTPATGEALIRILLAGICATDLEIGRGYKNFRGILGHEFVGIVESAPDPAWQGVRVVGEINCGCGSCGACRLGQPSHCPHRTVPGILGRDGVFADYCVLPVANLHPVPATVSDQAAVFTEPLAAALAITRQVHLPPHERVVVVGDGRLGLLVAQVLAGLGCDLLVVGHHAQKWSVLQAQGIRACLDTKIPAGLKAATVVECTGCAAGFYLACRLLQPKGQLVLKSTFHGTTPIDLSHLVVEELTVIGSRCGPFPPAVRLLEQQRVQVEPLITTIYPLAQGLQALAHAGQRGVLKVLIRP